MAKRKEKSRRGWYHSGEDSFDSPEIVHLDDSAEGFGCPQWGPFRTYEAAQKDLESMVTSSIRNLQDLYDNVIRLRKAKNNGKKTRS